MGNGIAQVFAQAGFDVRLMTSSPPRARPRARRHREEPRESSSRRASCRPPIATPRSARLATATQLDALAAADYVVEAIVEDVDAKRALFARLDAITQPDVILASNTSSISITLLGAATKRPDNVLGMHFMNPVPLMTLVELIRGQATSRRVDGDRDGAVTRRSARRRSKRPTIPASSPTAS